MRPEGFRRGKRNSCGPLRTERARALVPRVVADTDIYVSALNFGGPPERLLRLAEAVGIQLVISDGIIAEVTKTLRANGMKMPKGRLVTR